MRDRGTAELSECGDEVEECMRSYSVATEHILSLSFFPLMMAVSLKIKSYDVHCDLRFYMKCVICAMQSYKLTCCKTGYYFFIHHMKPKDT